MEKRAEGGERIGKKRLGDLLVEVGILNPANLQRALEEQKRSGRRLGETLVQLQLISESQMARSLASQRGIRYVEPTAMRVDPGLLSRIPQSLAKRHLAVPLEVQDKKLVVAMVDPFDYESINDLRFRTGMAIEPVVATRKEITEMIEQHYRLDTSVEKIVEASARDFGNDSVQVMTDLEEPPPGHAEVRALEERSRLAPVIQLANSILSKAIRLRASDIHIEPGRKDCRVRYRIDGLLKEEMRLPKWVQSPLVSRIKIMARQDIAERRLPQDGALRVRAENHEIDLRVSTLPTHHGEKIVLRILDQSRMLIRLDQCGLLEKDIASVRMMMKKKKGMILVTGPTGSGKTTTLYGMIHELKSETNNLTTVEDPVEYTIEGINQVQVNPEIGLTFAAVLRSILRQDPNIIFVGEIRDLETAEIAFRAAMTGHLVLSTLHTNDAPSTITRLIDLGIPRYLVSSALVGIIAQRLVRKLCPDCKVPAPSDRAEASLAGVPGAAASFFQERGCAACRYAGFSGRIGIFEVLTASNKLRDLITAGAADEEIRSAGSLSGMTSIEQDGLLKVRQGITTPEEVMRVVELQEGIQTLCPRCKRAIQIDFLICPHCEWASPYVCSSCGKSVQSAWSACPYCRHKVAPSPDRDIDRNQKEKEKF